jgi:uncharacterized protein
MSAGLLLSLGVESMNKSRKSSINLSLLGDTAALKAAIKDGLDLEERDRDGRTLLANATLSNDIESVAILLQAGANPNSPDTNGFTALHHAAQRYFAPIVKLLISNGAAIDAVDSFGNTSLFRAIFESRGRREVIDLLLTAGANQHQINNSGVTPRELAKSISNFDVFSLLPE